MGNVVMEATQINYRRDDTMKTVDQKLQELSQESAIDTDIAPVFKSTSTYNPGNLVYYRNKLYKCITQHTGAWASVDFAATDVSTALNDAVGALDDTKADLTDLATPFNSETSYTAGDLVIYNGIIYRCTNDHTGDWDADDFSATTIGAELNAINSNISSLITVIKVTSNDQGALTEIPYPSGYNFGNTAILGVAVLDSNVRYWFEDRDTNNTYGHYCYTDSLGITLIAHESWEQGKPFNIIITKVDLT